MQRERWDSINQQDKKFVLYPFNDTSVDILAYKWNLLHTQINGILGTFIQKMDTLTTTSSFLDKSGKNKRWLYIEM